MQFIPSPYSLPHASSYGEADWRLLNVFSKAGRAENKKARAKKLKGKAAAAKKAGKTKKSARLVRRADKKQLRAARLTSKGVIEPRFSNAEKLWEAGHPFGARAPKKGMWARTGVQRMRLMAEGYKPSRKYINLEYRTTIVGGLCILATAANPETGGPGYAPFAEKVDCDSLMGLIRGKGTRYDDQLLKVVRVCAKAEGKKRPRSLQAASRYVIDAVVRRGLARPAWAQRALLMVGAATSRLAKSSAIGGIAGAAAVTIAGIVVTIATAGAAGAPSAAAIMGVAGSTAGLVGAATGTRSKIGQAKLGGKWSEYQAEVQSALGQREVQIQDDQTQIRIEAFEELEDEVELASMMRNKARGRIIGLSFYAGLGIIGLSLFARARK